MKVIAFLLLLVTINSFTFCSSYCAKNGCNGWTANNCDGQCNTAWGWNYAGGLCSLTAASKKQFIDISQQAGGNINVLPNGGVNSCNNISSTPVNGAYKASTTVRFSLVGGTIIPHWGLDLIFGLILVDVGGSNRWDSNGKMTVTLDSQVPPQAQQTQQFNSPADRGKTSCKDTGQWDQYYQVKLSYTHNTIGTNIDFALTSTNSPSNAEYMIKQVIYVAKLCDPACAICFGSSNINCNLCISPYMLSNFTCSLTCIGGYGPTTDPLFCVLCDKKCTACFDQSDNCQSCRSTNPNASFLQFNSTLGYDTCVITCQPGSFGNTTSRVCDPCDSSCLTCSNSALKCLTCPPTFSWLNFTCYSPCPVGYFNSSTNCTLCNSTCSQCLNLTYCTICKTVAPIGYLINNTCVNPCPIQYYSSSNGTVGPNLCLSCDPACKTCTNNPLPCQSCNNNSFLFNFTCISACPTNYISYTPTWECLDCQLSCVDLSIKMYFPFSYSQQIYIDMTFSRSIDFTIFDYVNFQTISVNNYPLSAFTLNYTIIDSKTYRIKIKPVGYIFLYNETVTVTTKSISTPIDNSIDGMPFKNTTYGQAASLNWFLLRSPQMSALQKTIINNVASISSAIASATTHPLVAQFKKSGLLAMLFSGAQITSCSIFVNSVPAQNMYQGVRIWAIFVFYDVPEWQQNSKIPNKVVVPDVYDLVKNQRRLFDMTTIAWRFHRTGQSSFFMYDVYVPIILITVCWLLALFGRCCKNSFKSKAIQSKFFTIMHKIHQAAILYVTMGMMLQWMYFDGNSLQRYISLSICAIFNIYFVLYELYIYYDMISYPEAAIGNQKYQYYLIRYGSFLKNIRFQQYKLSVKWSPSHWFRPYNYHLLSYYKKFCMIISLPLFYHIKYAQAAILIFLQLMELFRFCKTKPYFARWRNIYRGLLQIFLLLFFLTVLVESLIFQQITKNDPATLPNYINIFTIIGWIGFVLVFLFNLGFLLLFFIDIVQSFRYSNRQLMDQSRRFYYYNNITDYEQENDQVPLNLLNRWVKFGNLNKRNKDELPDINIRIESYRIKSKDSYYDVDILRTVELFVNSQLNYDKENNTTVGKRIKKRIKLTKQTCPSFYDKVNELFRKYGKMEIEAITIKTFMQVRQRQFEVDEKIPLKLSSMFQRIELQNIVGQVQTIKLKKMLSGFPLNSTQLQSF